MLRDINRVFPADKKAFTLVETLISTIIMVLILSSVWSIYFMGWKWWYEMEPIVETQRIARIAVSSVIDGMMDSTAGEDTINGVEYGFRNGIAFATLTNEDRINDPNFITPVISSNGLRIDFKL